MNAKEKYLLEVHVLEMSKLSPMQLAAIKSFRWIPLKLDRDSVKNLFSLKHISFDNNVCKKLTEKCEC